VLSELVPNIRVVTADDLGIGARAQAAAGLASTAPDATAVNSDDPIILEIIAQVPNYGGVILTGPPGTSKSFYARAAAEQLTGHDKHRFDIVQFHGSYQYEDFIFGFTPTEKGFKPKLGPFLRMINAARLDPDNLYVLVIDELSRADVGRVFGEALTYVERTKREFPFTIANGDEVLVPSNFFVISTMNPFDRGVDEVDAAFERRFSKISMEPDAALLDNRLVDNGMDDGLRGRLIGWFRRINSHAEHNPAASVGHAYFWATTDEGALRDVWDHQLKYLVQRAFRRELGLRQELEAAWEQVFDVPAPDEAPPDEIGSVVDETPAS